MNRFILYLEKWLPLLLSVLLTWIAKMYLDDLPTSIANKVFGAFTTGGITATTTLLGFLLTVYTIFQATNSTRKQHIMQLGMLSRINNYTKSAILALLFASLSLLAVTTLPVESTPDDIYYLRIQVCVIFITTLSLLLSIRFIFIFLQLIVVDNDAAK